jgi:hypothetical protein
MKRENIIGYVKDPNRLGQSTLTEVEELVESYPYFQTAHMLLARNHHNMDSLRFHDMLRSAAAFAGDRTVLYHLIHGTIPKPGLLKPEVASPGVTSPEVTGQDVTGPDMPGEPEGMEAEGRDGISGKLADILSRETGDAELDYGPSYSLEETGKETVLPVDEQEEGTATATIEEYTFTGWFDHIGEAYPVPVPPPEQKDLIEKFLDELPAIKPDPGKVPDQTDRSEAYGKADDSLMTETLAKIFLKQGLYRKAIHAYEKLSLKYPEKSTYFATQIKRIKRNLENE